MLANVPLLDMGSDDEVQKRVAACAGVQAQSLVFEKYSVSANCSGLKFAFTDVPRDIDSLTTESLKAALDDLLPADARNSFRVLKFYHSVRRIYSE